MNAADSDAGQNGPARPDPDLSPDVAAVGGLQAALQAEFDRSDCRLTALPERAPGWRLVGARIEDAHRHTSVVMGIRERVFTMEFWAQLPQGVYMAHGNTADLHAVAGAINTWQTGARVRELSTAWPFVQFSPLVPRP